VWPYLRKQAGELGERLKQKDSLLNKCEALSSNPSATKKKKKPKLVVVSHAYSSNYMGARLRRIMVRD
jgi:hypothetical protein